MPENNSVSSISTKDITIPWLKSLKKKYQRKGLANKDVHKFSIAENTNNLFNRKQVHDKCGGCVHVDHSDCIGTFLSQVSRPLASPDRDPCLNLEPDNSKWKSLSKIKADKQTLRKLIGTTEYESYRQVKDWIRTMLRRMPYLLATWTALFQLFFA